MFIDLRRGQGYRGELEKINRSYSNLSITITLKNTAVNKMSLRVIDYYPDEYIYTLSNRGILISFKDYSIVKQNEMIALAA